MTITKGKIKVVEYKAKFVVFNPQMKFKAIIHAHTNPK